jgi:hypothetical protein
VAEKGKISITSLLFWTGVSLVLLMGLVVALFWNRLPPQLPWLYSFPWGEKQLMDRTWFYWIFGGMEVVLFLTRAVANWAGKEDVTVQNTIMIGVFTAVVLMLASFYRVMTIFLNI